MFGVCKVSYQFSACLVVTDRLFPLKQGPVLFYVSRNRNSRSKVVVDCSTHVSVRIQPRPLASQEVERVFTERFRSYTELEERGDSFRARFARFRIHKEFRDEFLVEVVC